MLGSEDGTTAIPLEHLRFKIILQVRADGEIGFVAFAQLYLALIGSHTHGLHQLVHFLVVLQRVPQGLLGAQEPLSQARHLGVRPRRFHHREAAMLRRRPFTPLRSGEGARNQTWSKDFK